MDDIAIEKNRVKYAEWNAMVEACQNSGLPITTWCKENFISSKTYYYRLRKLRQLYLAEHSEKPVVEIAPLPVAPQQSVAPSNITIHFDGMSIDIPDGTSENTIASLLRAVKTTW